MLDLTDNGRYILVRSEFSTPVPTFDASNTWLYELNAKYFHYSTLPEDCTFPEHRVTISCKYNFKNSRQMLNIIRIKEYQFFDNLCSTKINDTNFL